MPRSTAKTNSFNAFFFFFLRKMGEIEMKGCDGNTKEEFLYFKNVHRWTISPGLSKNSFEICWKSKDHCSNSF